MDAVSKVYSKFIIKALNGEINWLTDDIKVMLCNDTYTPDRFNHTYKTDVTGEISATGYNPGGISLTGKTIKQNNMTSSIVLNADRVVWNNATLTAKVAVVYSNAGSKPLIGYIDFGNNITNSSQGFGLSWSYNGMFSINFY